jgi:hypothetical protein
VQPCLESKVCLIVNDSINVPGCYAVRYPPNEGQYKYSFPSPTKADRASLRVLHTKSTVSCIIAAERDHENIQLEFFKFPMRSVRAFSLKGFIR